MTNNRSNLLGLRFIAKLPYILIFLVTAASCLPVKDESLLQGSFETTKSRAKVFIDASGKVQATIAGREARVLQAIFAPQTKGKFAPDPEQSNVYSLKLDYSKSYFLTLMEQQDSSNPNKEKVFCLSRANLHASDQDENADSSCLTFASACKQSGGSIVDSTADPKVFTKCQCSGSPVFFSEAIFEAQIMSAFQLSKSFGSSFCPATVDESP